MIYQALKLMFPNIADDQFMLQDDSDGEGPYIKVWSYPEPQPTMEQIQAVFPRVMINQLMKDTTDAVQKRLDDFAKTRSYDNIFTCASYATSKNPRFSSDGQYAVDIRDAHWATCYQIMEEVQQGTRELPTVEEILAEMPAMEWPN